MARQGLDKHSARWVPPNTARQESSTPHIEVVVPYLRAPCNDVQNIDLQQAQIQEALAKNLLQQSVIQAELAAFAPTLPTKAKAVVLDDRSDHGREVNISNA